MKKDKKGSKQQVKQQGVPSKKEWDAELREVQEKRGLDRAVEFDNARGTFYARQHRGIERVDINVDGRVKPAVKTINAARQMWLSGEITREMYDIAVDYKQLFDLAALDPLRASPMDGMPRTTGTYRQVDESPSVHRARIRISMIHHNLNGQGSRMSMAMWNVIGLEDGFGGRDVDRRVSAALKESLINALQTLLCHRNGHFKKSP